MSQDDDIVVDQVGRLDRFVRDRLDGIGRNKISRLIKAKKILVNGKAAVKGQELAIGDRVEILSSEVLAPPKDAPLDIAFENDDFVIVNKPAGLPTMPLGPNDPDSLGQRVIARFPQCRHLGDDERECGLAHRLDTGTSGLVVVAKDQHSWKSLRELFRCKQVTKHYLAVTEVADETTGIVAEPLKQVGKKSVVDVAGLPATTRYQELQREADWSLVRCQTETGRRHQLRVHLSHVGRPIVGDQHYGGATLNTGPEGGFCLHGEVIEFVWHDKRVSITQHPPSWWNLAFPQLKKAKPQ